MYLVILINLSKLNMPLQIHKDQALCHFRLLIMLIGCSARKWSLYYSDSVASSTIPVGYNEHRE